MKKTYNDLVKENKELKTIINKENLKERCWRCHGTGEIWTYWDGDTYCPECHGSGWH
jgi:DnaJ-class molecular chaperone